MIDAYLIDSVTWRRYNGVDQWGSAVAPTDTAVRARAVMQVERVRDFAGEEVTAAGHLFVTAKPLPQDRFIIDSEERSVLAIQPVRSLTQTAYYQVWIK